MKTSLFKSLYFQVLTAIAIGILLGHYYPELGAQMKPLGDAFVKLIKMIIAPVIFCTVVTGIAGMESMKAVGRTGAVALLYFEIVSTIALIIGLIIVNVVQPGAGMNVDPATLDAQAVAVYAAQAKEQGIIAFLMDVIPGSVIRRVCQRQHSAGLTVCGVVWFCAAPFGQQRPAHFQCD
ncbi:cation:dicarboxylase symporter family transporter [Salmonella enterica subsp. enterica]